MNPEFVLFWVAVGILLGGGAESAEHKSTPDTPVGCISAVAAGLMLMVAIGFWAFAHFRYVG